MFRVSPSGGHGKDSLPPSSVNVLCYLQNYQMLPSKLQNIWSHYPTKLIHFSKKLPPELYCRQSKYFLLIYNIYILSISGVVFAVPFLCFFQKLQVLVVKEFRNNFLLHYTSVCMNSKSVPQIFKKMCITLWCLLVDVFY